MPLTKLNAFTKLISNLADKPNMSATDLKAYFDSSPEELRVALNNLIDVLSSTTMDSGAKNIKASAITGLVGSDVQTLLEALKTLVDTKANATDVFSKTDLQSVTDANSGADKIKATPISTSPDTVQGILEWLKSQIDTVVLGSIPDGSVTEQKLSFNPATQSELDTHTGNTTIHITSTERTTWNGKVNNSEKGEANGIATLDSSGKVPTSQLPGSRVLLQTLNGDGVATSFSFTGIPASYKALLVVISGNANTGSSGTTSNLSLKLNNDTTTNYHVAGYQSTTTLSFYGGSGSNSVSVGALPNTGSTPLYSEVYLPNYTSSVAKIGHVNAVRLGASLEVVNADFMHSNLSAAISSLVFTSTYTPTTNFKLELFGIN